MSIKQPIEIGRAPSEQTQTVYDDDGETVGASAFTCPHFKADKQIARSFKIVNIYCSLINVHYNGVISLIDC